MNKKKGKSKKKKPAPPKVYEMPTIFKPVERKPVIIKQCLDYNKIRSELKEKIEKYKEDKIKKIYDNIEIENSEFVVPFFEKLKLTFDYIENMTDEYSKSLNYNELWTWYCEKTKNYNDIFKINARTKEGVYEKLDNINVSEKNEYFEAKNYPTEFEIHHRTQDGAILPSKDRLKEVSRKQVEGYIDPKTVDYFDRRKSFVFDHLLYKKEKDELFAKIQSAKIYKQSNTLKNKKDEIENLKEIGIIPTKYNEAKIQKMQSNNQSIINNDNVNITQNSSFTNFKHEIGAKREIKSSYVHYKGDYEYISLNVENKKMAITNKDLKEKRNIQEHKEFLNEWGRAKSHYKTTREIKHEIKDIINNEEKQILKSKEICSSNIKEIKTVFGSIINIGEKKKDDIKENTEFLNDLEEVMEFKEDNKPILNKVDITRPFTALTSANSTGMNSSFTTKSKNINIKNRNLFSAKLEKLQLYKNDINREKIPTSATIQLRNHDKVFDIRSNFNKFIDVKQIDNSKNSYAYHFTPLSAFDRKNINSKEKENQLSKNKIQCRPKSGVELLRNKKYDCLNLLETRKLLADLNTNLVKDVKDHMNKKGVILKNLNEKILNPNIESRYNNYYLPKSNMNLLDRPKDPKAKKRKKGKSKTKSKSRK